MKRSQALYIKDIKDAIEAAIKFTNNMTYDEFNTDDKTLSAVIRKLEVIGEAVKNLSIDITSSTSDIPWSIMARMRDKLIHGYFGVDIAIIWRTVKEELPDILPLIIKLYNQNKNDT